MIPINYNYHGIKVPVQNFETDLFISVTTRPMIEDEIHPIHFSYYQNDNRPIQGFLNVPPSKIPSEIEKEDSPESYFFMKLLHDTVHIMGFTLDYMKNWLNRKTGLPWGENFPLKSFSHPLYPNKNFTILYTPNVHHICKEKFGIKEFLPGVPIGIELEHDDEREKGHPKSRLFLNDFLVSEPFHFPLIISQFSLAIIEDMGWYTPNYIFGNKIKYWGEDDGKPIEGFATKPPRSVIPSSYLCDYDDLDSTSYDYKYKSICLTSPYLCPNEPNTDDYYFCLNQNYYNPQYNNSRGIFRTLDFIPFKSSMASMSCIHNFSNNNFILSGLSDNYNMKLGYSSRITKFITNDYKFEYGCYETTCTLENQVIIDFLGKLYLCEYENQLIPVEGNKDMKYFVCPNPKILCETYWDTDILIRDWYVPLPGDPPLKINNIVPIKKSFPFLAISMILMLIVILYMINGRIKKENDERQDPEFRSILEDQ